jgi:hypothetical protein
MPHRATYMEECCHIIRQAAQQAHCQTFFSRDASLDSVLNINACSNLALHPVGQGRQTCTACYTTVFGSVMCNFVPQVAQVAPRLFEAILKDAYRARGDVRCSNAQCKALHATKSEFTRMHRIGSSRLCTHFGPMDSWLCTKNLYQESVPRILGFVPNGSGTQDVYQPRPRHEKDLSQRAEILYMEEHVRY